MADNKKTFLIDGNPVDVNSNDVASFKTKFPKAIEAQSFIVNGSDTVDVAVHDVDKFKSKFPDAKPTFQSTPPKGGDLPLTKDVGNTFGVPDFQESATIMADGSQTKPISALKSKIGTQKNLFLAHPVDGMKADMRSLPTGEDKLPEIKNALQNEVLNQNSKSLEDIGVKIPILANKEINPPGVETDYSNELINKFTHNKKDMMLDNPNYRGQIAEQLSKKYNVPQPQIEDYLTKLNDNKKEIRENLAEISLNPKNDKAYSSLGNNYFGIGEYDQAEKVYMAALSTNPNSEGAKNGLGSVALAKKDYPTAVQIFTELAQTNPNTDNIAKLATATYGTGNFEAAKQLADQAVTAGGDFPDSYALKIRATANAALGDNAASVADLKASKVAEDLATDQTVEYTNEKGQTQRITKRQQELDNEAQSLNAFVDVAHEVIQKGIDIVPEKIVADAIMQICTEMTHWDEVEKGYDESGENGAIAATLAKAARVGFSALAVYSPEVQKFMQQMQVGETILPSQAIGMVMQPISMMFTNEGASLENKNWAQLADIPVSLLIFHGLNVGGKKGYERAVELGDKIKQNLPLTKNEFAEIADGFNGITPKEVLAMDNNIAKNGTINTELSAVADSWKSLGEGGLEDTAPTGFEKPSLVKPKVGTPEIKVEEEHIRQQTVTNEIANEPTNPTVEGATPSGDNAVLETPKVEQVQAGGEEVKVGDEKQEGESYYRKINRITQDTPEYESMDVFQKVKHIFSKLTGTDGGNGSSKYHGFELPNGEVINLRVSDHTGNYEPNGQYVFSIVIDEDISGDKPRISNGENYTEVRLSADNKEVKNDLENYVLDIISDIEKVDSKKQVEEQVKNEDVPENEHNASLDALNNEAKKHGYIGIKQLNSAESTNENASPEIKKLLSDYGEHANKVKSIKNSDDVSSLNDDNFGLWAKANNVEYNEQGNTMPNERNLKAASLLHEVFTKRNDIKSANKLKKALELSRKKDNWTKESWNERWDEDLSDDEISNINKDNAEYNSQLDDVLSEINSSKSGTSALESKKTSNKVLEKTIEEENANNKGISDNEADKGNEGEVIADKESKNDKAGEGDGGDKKSDLDVPKNQGDLFKAPKEKTKLEQAKEDRKSAKEKLDAIKESRKNNKGGIAIGNLVDTELANARHDYHKATVKEIKEWLKEKAGSINDYLKDTGEKLTIALKTAWDEANGGKKIEKPEDLPYTNEDQPIIGITRAHIDPEQIERGLDKSDKLFKSQKNPELWDEIKKRMVSEPDLAIQRMDEISQEIAEGKSPKFSKEDAVIGLHERVRLKVERKQILSEQKAAIDSGNKPLAVDAALKLEQNSIANERNNLFIKKATSTYGGGLQSSQMLSTESYDYTSIKNRIEAEQGKPLSAEQEKQFKDISEKYQQFQDKLAENETKFAEKEKEYQKKLDEYHEELQKARTEQAQKSNKKEARKRPVDLAREAEKERLRKILGIKSRSNTNALFDPSTIINKDFIKYHKMVFEDAIGDFRHFTKEMIKDFGNGIKEHLPKLFKDSGGTDEQINAAKKTDIELNGEFDILTKKAILDADGEFHEGLKGVLDKMFNNRVEAGETDYKKNVQSIYDALEPHIKDLDKNDLGDLIGGYGKFKELTKDPAKLLAAEGRRNLVLDAKLREVNKGVLPKRNGQQRALKTKAERDKETAIAKGIREQNLTPEPNEQEQAATYASELESYHRSLERQIEDYDAEGKSGVKKERTVGIKRSEKFTDTKSKELEAERDRVKAIRDAVLKERAATELEKTVKRAKQLTDDINKAKKEGRTKDAEALQKEKDLTDGEIGNLVNAVLKERSEGEKKIDNLRKQIDDVLNGNTKEKTTKPELTDAEKQQVKVLQAELQKAKIDAGLIEKPLTAEEKQLESLQNQLDDLYAGKVKETADKKVDSAAVKELKDKIAAQRELMGLKAAKAEAGSGTINAIQKGIDDINAEIESLNSGTFDKEQTPNTRGGVTNFKTVKEKNTPQLTEEAKQKIKTLQGERDALQEQKNNLLPQHIKDLALINKTLKNRNRRLQFLRETIKGAKDGTISLDTKAQKKLEILSNDPNVKKAQKELDDTNIEIKKHENELYAIKEEHRLLNRSGFEMFVDKINDFTRNGAISRLTAIPKILGSGFMSQMFRPIENLVGVPSKYMMPKSVRSTATMEGQPYSLNAEAAVGKLLSPNSWKEGARKFATGGHRQDFLYGDKIVRDGKSAVKFMGKTYHFYDPMSVFGRSHALAKTPGYMAGYERNLRYARENAMAFHPEYFDSNNHLTPEAAKILEKAAHEFALPDAMLQPNGLAKSIRGGIHRMENSKKFGSRAVAKVGTNIFKVLNVSANYFATQLEYLPLAGTLKAYTKLLDTGEMTPERANDILRSNKRGMVGLGLFMTGMAFPQVFSGFDDKNKSGNIKIGDYEIPHWASHLPFFMAMQLGATVRHYMDSDPKDKHAFETFKNTADGIINQNPFAYTAHSFIHAMDSKTKASEFLYNEMFGQLIPQAAKEIGEWRDKDLSGETIKRQAHKVNDWSDVPKFASDMTRLASGINRDKVGKSKYQFYESSNSATQKFLEDKGIEITRFSAEPDHESGKEGTKVNGVFIPLTTEQEKKVDAEMEKIVMEEIESRIKSKSNVKFVGFENGELKQQTSIGLEGWKLQGLGKENLQTQIKELKERAKYLALVNLGYIKIKDIEDSEKAKALKEEAKNQELINNK